jgi:hypothetical protein
VIGWSAEGNSMQRILTATLLALGSCSSPYDDECVRRYLTMEREYWCLGERTMNGEENEPKRPLQAK